MEAGGAIFGNSWDLEVPLMFGPKGFEETPTLNRSNAFEHVGEEHKAVVRLVVCWISLALAVTR